MSDLQNNNIPQLEEIDIKEIFFKLLSHWKLFLVIVVISMFIAVIVNRYATNIYKLSTLINIKESENPLATSSMNLMFKWGGTSELVQSHIAILKSRRHNLKVIGRLNLELEYYSAGRVKMIKSYGKSPFLIEFDKSHVQPIGLAFEISLKPTGGYSLMYDESIDDIHTINYETKETDGVKAISLRGDFQFDQWIETRASRFKVVLDTSDIHFSETVTWYFRFANPKAIVDGYVSSLNVTEASDGGSLLNIAMTGDNKTKMVDYLNTSIDLLKEYELEQKNKLADNTIKFVDMQMSSVVDTLRSVEKELEEYRIENQLVDLGSESSELYSQYMSLETNKAELSMAEKYYNYLLEYLNNSDDFSSLMTPSVVGIEDPVLLQLVGRLVELSVERNKMQYSLQSENPVMEQIRSEIKLTKNSLKENVRNLIKATALRQKDINSRLGEMRSKLAELPTTEQELINIRRKYELSSSQYEFLIQKRAEAELLKAGNLPDVQVIDEAADYGDLPIKPKKALSYVIALMLGLILPAVYVFIKDFFNNKLNNKKELEKATNIPIIGTIGHSEGASNIVIQNGLKTSVAESFRIIRTNLNFIFKQSKSDDKSKVVLVTSSVGGEGKTFCSINLSAIISIAGSKTVIVGLDLRKPKIFNDFKFTNNHGLSEYLSGQLELQDILKPTDIDNLDFITAGPVPPNPGELLMSPRLEVLINELKKTYDYIVLDTPPITLVSDALELMKYADATLYVTRQNYTQKELLHVINEQFEDRGLKNISIIFNDVLKQGYGYDYGYNYGYNYGYGYGYYDEDEVKLSWWKRVI